MSQSLSRRSFLKCAGSGAVSLAAALLSGVSAAEPVAKLAGEIIDHAEKANSIFPSDNQRIEMRKAHLLEARASLMALDVRLTHVYLILNQNPEGAFTTSKGNQVKSQDAMEKLDKMAQNLGELIDKENELLKGAIKNVTAKQK